MPPRRPVRTALTAALVALPGVTVAGCGDTGGLRGSGAAPTAISPMKL
ncbi:hypothetical protein ABT124_42685 [Streptomyces sp. NPDC001982]